MVVERALLGVESGDDVADEADQIAYDFSARSAKGAPESDRESLRSDDFETEGHLARRGAKLAMKEAGIQDPENYGQKEHWHGSRE